MNPSMSTKTTETRMAPIVKFLFWLALITQIISCLASFFVIEYRMIPSSDRPSDSFLVVTPNEAHTAGEIVGGDHLIIDGDGSFYRDWFSPNLSDYEMVPELVFRVPSDIFSILSLLLNLAPSVLLVIFMTFFYKEDTGAFVFPMALFAWAINQLLPVFMPSFLGVENMVGFAALIPNVITAIVFIVAAIFTIKNQKSKLFVTIATATSLVFSLLTSSLFLFTGAPFDSSMEIYDYFIIAGNISSLALRVGLLLFALFCQIPVVGKAQRDDTASAEMAVQTAEETAETPIDKTSDES